jgi:hypothetical protein
MLMGPHSGRDFTRQLAGFLLLCGRARSAGCNLDDRVRRVELHHAHRAQVRDFHALELIEEPAPIGVGAAFGHEAR